jgi:hypothetical protein
LAEKGLAKNQTNSHQGFKFRGIDARRIGNLPYLVTRNGDVISERVSRPLKQALVVGYPRVSLYVSGEQIQANVHVLVLEAFAGPRPDGMVANHKNCIKTDNRAENLEWVTQSENVLHAYRNGRRIINAAHKARCAENGRNRRSYTDEQANHIRSSFSGARGDITRISKLTGISRYAVADIIRSAA